jgi:hypothetical protein
MNASTLLLILVPVGLVVVPFVIIPRLQMERRARALLSRHPDAERTSVFLAFRSLWSGGKRQEMDARIAEMATTGWTFLRATEANPLRTIRSRGGGLTLHFIRGSADTNESVSV